MNYQILLSTIPYQFSIFFERLYLPPLSVLFKAPSLWGHSSHLYLEKIKNKKKEKAMKFFFFRSPKPYLSYNFKTNKNRVAFLFIATKKIPEHFSQNNYSLQTPCFLKFHFYVIFECSACMSYVCRYPRSPKEGTGSPGTGTMDDCDLSCGCWKTNPGPLQRG